jgi:hypothetical protein
MSNEEDDRTIPKNAAAIIFKDSEDGEGIGVTVVFVDGFHPQKNPDGLSGLALQALRLLQEHVFNDDGEVEDDD